MEVNDALVTKLAGLAGLKFDLNEKDAIREDLERMIRFIDKLNEVDTTGVEPILHMSDGVNRFREDEVNGSISREAAFLNAPAHDNEFFKVPKVISK